MASSLDIKIVKNNDITLQFSVKDKNGAALNITDFQLKWQVKKTYKSEAVITKTSINGIQMVSPSEGTFIVSISATDTVNLEPGSYFHEAIATDTLGKSVTLTDLGMSVGVFLVREQYTDQY